MKLCAVLLVCFASLALVTSNEPDNNQFHREAFGVIAEEHPTENVIVSPASIHTCLGLAYLGAEGTTAAELKDVLKLKGTTKEEVAHFFGEFFDKIENKGFPEMTKLTIANRVYVDGKYEIAPKFNELATKHFDSKAESVDFGDAVATAGKINSWVSEHTNNKIHDIVSPGSLDASTSAVLVNAIYFKGHWKDRFEVEDTKKKDFFLTETEKSPVDMMFQTDYFLHADWEDIDATALKIPYANTDLYMMVILPKKVNGLKAVIENLKTANIRSLHERFESRKVNLHLPKFKFEFNIKLNDVLSKMGIKSMFSPNADFSSLLKEHQALPVSEVVHKAFIEVDEIGTEAAAATLIAVPMMAVQHPKDAMVYEFNVDHPFMFVINDKDTLYFAGKVNKV